MTLLKLKGVASVSVIIRLISSSGVNMDERGTAFDPSLWKGLPSELLVRILEWLPLRSLVLFRSVSSEWRTMIDSARVVYSGPPGKPVVFYNDPGDYSYNLVEVGESRSRPSLAFPNSSMSTWSRHTLPFAEESCDYSTAEGSNNVLVAADGGLLCFSGQFAVDTFTVYNPLTKRWRELKPPSPAFSRLPQKRFRYYGSRLHFLLVGLVMNQETGNYKLILAGFEADGSRDLETQVYDSGTGVWKSTDPAPPVPLEYGTWYAERGMCCSGNMYWHVYGSQLFWTEDVVHGLLKFDLQLERWTFVRQSTPSESPFLMEIVPHQGKVLLLAWGDSELPEDYIASEAEELLRLGPEVKLMHAGLRELIHRPVGGMTTGVMNEGVAYPAGIIGQENALYFAYPCLPPNKLYPLRVLVCSESVWLPKYDSVIGF